MSDSSYYKDWWQANRERVLRDRAERYRKDEEYRESLITRSRKRSKDRSLMRKIELIKNPPRVKHGGKIESVRRLSDLLVAINRCRDAFYRLRKKGVIPHPIHHNSSKVGVYCDSQIEYLKAIFDMVDSGIKITGPQLGVALHQVWDKPFKERTLALVIKQMGGSENEKAGKVHCHGGTSCNCVGNSKRGSDTEDRKGTEVRRGACNCKGKHGGHKEHGQLRESASRRGSLAAL